MSAPQVDLILAVSALILGLIFPRLGSKTFEYIEARFAVVARRPLIACATVTVLALSLRLALLPILPIPEPAIHDEFSYLLAADTFSKGRLTNPTHPMWVHFETFHVNQHPTYMSMYPPAQGLILAAGKLATGKPWFGVWLITGLLCGAITWALQGWLPPGWAFFGGLLFMVRIGLFSYWMNSYYGASIAAFGGALVTGALPRLLRAPSSSTAAVLGVGALILANSRPFEGFLLCLTAVVILLVPMYKNRGWRRDLFRHGFIPLVVLAGIGGASMAYYNWRVYGNALTLSYVSNRATYAVAPVFVWETPGPIPEYRHPVMRDFYVGYELSTFLSATGQYGLPAHWVVEALRFWDFFLYPLLSLALLLGLYWLITDAQMRPVWTLFLVCAAGVGTIAFFMAHYMAPAVAAFYILLVQSMRLASSRLWPSRSCGLAMVRNLAAAAAMMAVIAPAYVSPSFHFGANWHFVFPPIPGRAGILRQLDRQPGRDLVIVRYRPGHPVMNEWVYNEADIDAAEIVWAREMDAANNRELITYFKGRKIWLLEADQNPPRLSAYADPP